MNRYNELIATLWQFVIAIEGALFYMMAKCICKLPELMKFF